MKRSRLWHKWLIGRHVAVWAGRSDYDHPARWVGAFIRPLGEIELHVTSPTIHRHWLEERENPEPEEPAGIIVRQSINVPPDVVAIDWSSLRYSNGVS